MGYLFFVNLKDKKIPYVYTRNYEKQPKTIWNKCKSCMCPPNIGELKKKKKNLKEATSKLPACKLIERTLIEETIVLKNEAPPWLCSPDKQKTLPQLLYVSETLFVKRETELNPCSWLEEGGSEPPWRISQFTPSISRPRRFSHYLPSDLPLKNSRIWDVANVARKITPWNCYPSSLSIWKPLTDGLEDSSIPHILGNISTVLENLDL